MAATGRVPQEFCRQVRANPSTEGGDKGTVDTSIRRAIVSKAMRGIRSGFARAQSHFRRMCIVRLRAPMQSVAP